MFLVLQHEKNEIQKTALEYIRLQLIHDLLLKNLGYGHINYDIDELNEVRKSVYTKYWLMNNVETCCIINPLPTYMNIITQNQPTLQMKLRCHDQTSHTNLLNANHHVNKAVKIEYIAKYQLFDYRIIRVGPEVEILTKPGLKDRLRRMVTRMKSKFKSPISPIKKKIPDKASKGFKTAHRKFLSYELQRIRAAT